MTPDTKMQTVEMFGKQIEYDPSKTYGTFNSQGQYGRIPVEKTLPRFAQGGDKFQFLEFLDDQVGHLTRSLEDKSITEELLNEGILVNEGSFNDDVGAVNAEKQNVPNIEGGIGQYIQNTIDLFTYIAETLRS